MKRLFFFLALLLGSLATFSQSKNDKVNGVKVYLDKYGHDGRDSVIKGSLISATSFRKVVKSTFGQLATGQTSASVLSNFASLDIVQGKFNFSGSLPLTNNFFLTAALAGEIDNNIGQLFKNYKLNNNTSIDLRAHLRIPRWSTFFYYPDDRMKLRKSVWKVHNQFEIDSISIVADSSLASNKLELLAMETDSLERRVRILHGFASEKRMAVNSSVRDDVKSMEQDTLRSNLRELLETKEKYFASKRSYDSLNRAIDHKAEYYADLHKAALKKRQDKTESMELNAEWSAIRMQWFSLRISPTRSKFYMLDTARAFAGQVFDTVLTNLYVGLEYSFYYYSRKRKNTHYFNVGAGFSRTDNRKDLNTYDVSDTWERDSARFTRTYTSKVNAYNGLLEEPRSFIIYSNYYLFTNGSTSLGFHFFPQALLQDGFKPQFGAGVGLVFSFKKKGEEKTIINAEPYYKMNDFTDALGSGSSVWKRNEIGIRIGLPFNPDGYKVDK